jgi:3' terminal RNA ribose 2'-O-methyltransferase Hen1
MLLSITTTHAPATDLGYLLHKHPDRAQTYDLAFGRAHVFYPEAGESRCTACLVIDVDPVGLVRGKPGERTLDQYVNDRPYAASSMLAVAIARVFGTALSGICKPRPDLVTTPIPLEASIPALPCRGGPELLRRLFEPLGYTVSAVTRPLDTAFPSWGDSAVIGVSISGTVTLTDLLSHLYVLIPVLDNEKHYWVGDDEVAKLLRHGGGWLARHPERELIARRFLKYRRNLADECIRQLREQDGDAQADIDAESTVDPREEEGERKLSLHQQRHGVIVSVLEARGVRRVVDLGCGEGHLLRDLLSRPFFEKVLGMDVAHRSLEIAADRLHLERLPPRQRERIELIHGSLLYRDRRIEGFDAAILCEVIEHLDEPRLEAATEVVFRVAKPGLVIVTTPNREYNVMWESLTAGATRHKDHRFEWSRDEFRAWADTVCARFGYSCETSGIGDPGITPDGHAVGCPTQMGVFSRVT